MSCNKKSFSNKSNLLQHRNCGCSNYFYKQDTWLPYTQDILKFLKISEFFDLYFTQDTFFETQKVLRFSYTSRQFFFFFECQLVN